MSDKIPPDLLTEIYIINELDRDINPDFPLSMPLIKAEQDKDTKLQSLLKHNHYKLSFGILTFGDHKVHTFNNKFGYHRVFNNESSNGTIPTFATPE